MVYQLHGNPTPARFSRGPAHCLRRLNTAARPDCDCKGVSPRLCIVTRGLPCPLCGPVDVAHSVGGPGVPAVWLRTDGNVSVCSMLRRDLPGFLCQGAKGSAARKGVRAVRSRLGSVQVETQDGDDQLRLDPTADLLVHCKAGIAVLVIPSAHGQSRYLAGIVIQHLVHRLWVAPHSGGDHRIRDQLVLTHLRHLPSALLAAHRLAACDD